MRMNVAAIWILIMFVGKEFDFFLHLKCHDFVIRRIRKYDELLAAIRVLRVRPGPNNFIHTRDSRLTCRTGGAPSFTGPMISRLTRGPQLVEFEILLHAPSP